MSDAPSLDTLARLAAAAAEHLAALDSACVHPARASLLWRCGWCDGCAARADALEALGTKGADLARHLVAAVDALRAERGRRDRMIASFGRLDMSAAELGNIVVAMRSKLAAAEAQRDALAAATAEYLDAADAGGCGNGEPTMAEYAVAQVARKHLDALLSGAPADVVRAGVVRAYRDAVEEHRRAGVMPSSDHPARARLRAATEALDAALAAAEGR